MLQKLAHLWKMLWSLNNIWLSREKLMMCIKWKQCQPSGLLPPKIMASMGTPSSLSHWGSMMGHWAAGAQKRELGWAHGVELPFHTEGTTVYSTFTALETIEYHCVCSYSTSQNCTCFGIPLDGTVYTVAVQFTPHWHIDILSSFI